jgi:DNA-binding LytR/AlgR family response regulator
MWVLMGFAFITAFATSIVFILLPKVFKHCYRPDKWTIGKNLLNNFFLLLLLCICVVFYDYFIVMKQLPEYFHTGFPVDLFATLTIGIVPISIITMIAQNRVLKQNLHDTKKINKVLAGRTKSDVTEEGLITLTGSTKESITVKAEDLLYMEATGNYVNVHYRQDNKITCKLLRSTIRQVEEALQRQSVFVRCHRTFIVNTGKIYHVTGNAQGYKLSLYDISEKVPVSRTYLKSLRDILR